jgi:hypothetical protein
VQIFLLVNENIHKWGQKTNLLANKSTRRSRVISVHFREILSGYFLFSRFDWYWPIVMQLVVKHMKEIIIKKNSYLQLHYKCKPSQPDSIASPSVPDKSHCRIIYDRSIMHIINNSNFWFYNAKVGFIQILINIFFGNFVNRYWKLIPESLV